ncbi:prenyltransferase/squalene oxidase repeat-containing protein [Pirellulaceae bacterium SH449]
MMSPAEKKGNMLWPLDLAFTLLGALVLFLVLRLLSFDSPDPLKNAWTYVLGVPTVLIAVSMLTHVFSNESVERSIQIGFLLSVSLHLILAFAAVNLVLFGGFWDNDQLQVKPEPTRKDKSTPQYLQASVPSADAAKREYLKTPQEPREKPKEVENSSVRENIAAEVKLVDSKLDLDTKIAERSFLLERPQESVPQPTIASSAMKLDRPKVSVMQDVSQSSIELPQLPQFERTNLGDLAANDSRLDESQRGDTPRDALRLPESKPEMSSVANRAARVSEMTPPAARSDINQQLESALANSQQAVSSSPNQNRQPRNPTESLANALPGAGEAVPVPQLVSPSSRFNPRDDIAGAVNTDASSSESRGDVVSANSSASISSVLGPQMDLQPRASPSGSIGRTQAASGMRIDERFDFLTRAEPLPGTGGSAAGGGGSTQPRSSSSMAANQNGPIATSAVPLDDIGIGAAIGVTVGNESSSNVNPAMADAALQRTLADGGDLRGSGSSSSRASPSIAMPAFELSDMTGPRPELPTRGLGIRPVEAALPELKVSDYVPDRLKRPDLAGPQSLSSSVPIPTPAFSQRLKRMEEREGEATSQLGPLGPQTELAIERGLQFLAKYQRPDGSWHLEDFDEPVRMRSPTAATALALLSFQGAGYTHQQFKYESVCKGALGWLMKQQRPNGDLYVRTDNVSNTNAWLYSHSMAALALCEAYGMTQDESVKNAAQRAIDFLVDSQDPEGGGWRYTPRIGSDTSVTGWVMMALKSAELSGLNVPQKTYAGLNKWINNSQAREAPYLYRYNWMANTPSTEHGRIPTPVMTSVGLLIRLYTGWRRDNEQMQKGVAWLLERLPAEGSRQSPLRDTYYWYYATQVIFHAGGESWKRWYGALYPMLIRTQVESGEYLGSWDPGGEVPDAWGAFGGRLYVTTLNLLSLEVYYRHLPLYEATAE